MSKLWMFIDGIITAPFFIVGYTVSAAVHTTKYGYWKYISNYEKAKKGQL